MRKRIKSNDIAIQNILSSNMEKSIIDNKQNNINDKDNNEYNQ